MTRDDIIRMAREAGFNWAWISEGQPRLERFYRAAYAAGAAAERKAILKKADSLGWVSVDDIRARGEA